MARIDLIKKLAAMDPAKMPARIDLTREHIEALDFLLRELSTQSAAVIEQERELRDAKETIRKQFGVEVLESESVKEGVLKAKEKTVAKQQPTTSKNSR